MSIEGSDNTGHRKEMAQFLPRHSATVLEIGCARGEFRTHVSLPNEYWGVEPDRARAAVAEDCLDKVLTGTYQEVEHQIPNAYFDLIVCNDVIEHLPDHDAFLQSIQKKMTADGCLIASIPNVRFIVNLFEVLVKKDWQYRSEGTLDRTHLRYFTKKSLIRTIGSNGYTIEKMMGINLWKPQIFLKQVVWLLVIAVCGEDTRFMQYGIRIRRKHSTTARAEE